MLNFKRINYKKPKYAKVNSVNLTDKPVVEPEEAARWIIENCTDKFSMNDIMEILDYELAYLASLGLADVSEDEFRSNLDYWKERNG